MPRLNAGTEWSQRTLCRAASAVLAAATVFFVISFARVEPAEGAPGDKLKGKWKAVAMVVGGKRLPVKGDRSIVYDYQDGGKFVVDMKEGNRNRRMTGTWTATATRVTMKVGKESKTATYKITGDKLKLVENQGGRQVIFHMKRVR